MIELVFNRIGGVVCHQLPERSVSAGGRLLPVCARCTGLYMGVFVGAVFLLAGRRLKGNRPPGVMGAAVLALALTPMLADAATSYAGLRETTNLARIVTGALFGVCVPMLYTLALRYDIHDVARRDAPPAGRIREADVLSENGKVIVESGSLLGLLAVAAALAVLIHAGLFGGWFSLSLIICASIVAAVAGLALLFRKLWNEFYYAGSGDHGKRR